MIPYSSLLEDIPKDRARAAHLGTSHSPGKRADQERESYADQLASDLGNLSRSWAKGGEAIDRDSFLSEFNRYRSGYRRRFLAYLDARSRCLSVLVTGGSRFPSRRNRKNNDIADRRLSELIEFRKRALRAIGRKIRPDLEPIRSGDSDATSRLREKIEKAEAQQQMWKAINRIVRSKPRSEYSEAKRERLAELMGSCSEQTGRRLFEPDCMGYVGIPSYQLTNNGANIRRMKQRLAQIEVTQSQPVEQTEANGITLEDDPPANRVRLFFPGRPSAEIRNQLKSSGFRWAPSIGAWQAYRNTRSLETARGFVA